MVNLAYIQKLQTEEATKILDQRLKFIKKIFKKKIEFYDPLNAKNAYCEFVNEIRKENYKFITEKPEDLKMEEYLEALIKNFLIEKTYFCLLFEEEDLVLKFVVDIMKKNSIPLNLSQDISLFVREKLEDKNKLAKIKESFKEGSKLKTYFYVMVRNAVMDFERKYNTRIELHDSFEMDKIKSSSPSPHLFPEENEIKERVTQLDNRSKIIFKMYYYESITNFNAIGRTLNISRHRAKKILEKAVEKVINGVV